MDTMTRSRPEPTTADALPQRAASVRDHELFERHALLLGLVTGVVVAFWTAGLFAQVRLGLAVGGISTVVYYAVWREHGLHHRVAGRRFDRARP